MMAAGTPWATTAAEHGRLAGPNGHGRPPEVGVLTDQVPFRKPVFGDEPGEKLGDWRGATGRYSCASARRLEAWAVGGNDFESRRWPSPSRWRGRPAETGHVRARADIARGPGAAAAVSFSRFIDSTWRGGTHRCRGRSAARER